MFFGIQSQSARELAEIEQLRAEQNAQIALARQLAAQAEFTPEDSFEKRTLKALLVIESLLRADTGPGIQLGFEAMRHLPRFTLAHEGEVWSVQFSADGTRLATASYDGTAGIWDTNSGERLQTLAHEKSVTSVQFSADSKRVATASTDDTAGIWDVNNGERLQTLAHEGDVTSVQFSADGTRVATASQDDTAGIWDVNSGERLQSLAHEDGVTSVQFSADGTRVATASWDFDDRKACQIGVMATR